MLNKDQLSILNDFFHSAIKPALEENKEELEVFMQKVEEYENWVQVQRVEECLLNSISTQMVSFSYFKDASFELGHFTTLKAKHPILDLIIESQNHNIISPIAESIITTKICTRKVNINLTAGKTSGKNIFAA